MRNLFSFRGKKFSIGLLIGWQLAFGIYVDPHGEEGGVLFGPFDFWVTYERVTWK